MNLTTANAQRTKHIVFESLNESYKIFLDRVKKCKTSMYAAGLFFDRKNALLVKDNQDGGGKIWNKIPGGVSKIEENIFNDEKYLTTLKGQLEFMKYRKSIIEAILALEKERISTRNVAERTMILELVEETGYYPTNFGYVMDGYRYNKDTKEHDLWQVYFQIHGIISPYSEDLEDKIQNIAKVRTAIPIDNDILNMRVIVPFDNLVTCLGAETHKIAAKKVFGKQSYYWMRRSKEADNPNMENAYLELSKKFALMSI